MNDLPSEELLSAYLDGEASADERVRVEKWLAESPEARQLLTELRALSAALASLPREPLPADFAQRVLRRAQRDLLAEPAAPPVAAASVEASSRRGRRPGIGRGLVWASLATAAAVLIMVFSRSAQQRPTAISLAPSPREAGRAARLEAKAESGLRKDANGRGAAPVARERANDGGTVDKSHLATISAPKDSPARATAKMAGERGAVGPALGVAAGRPSQPIAESTFGDVLIVECDVTPSAAQNDLLGAMLANEQVIVEDATAPPADATAAAAPSAQAAAITEIAPSSPGQMIYLVDATAGQLKKILANLKSQTEAVLRLEVSPAPQCANQLPLAAFNRAVAAAGAEVRTLPSDSQTFSQNLRNATPTTSDDGQVAAPDRLAEQQLLRQQLQALRAQETKNVAQSQNKSANVGAARRLTAGRLSQLAQSQLPPAQKSLDQGLRQFRAANPLRRSDDEQQARDLGSKPLPSGSVAQSAAAPSRQAPALGIAQSADADAPQLDDAEPLQAVFFLQVRAAQAQPPIGSKARSQGAATSPGKE